MGGFRVHGTGKAGWIFLIAFFKFSTFFGIRMFRIGWLLVGFWLMLGKLGAKGKDFFATDLKISTFFGLGHVPDRIGYWWGIFGASFAQRREDAKIFYWMPEKAEGQLWSCPLLLGGFAPLRESFRFGFGKEDVVSCSLIPLFTDSA
jgi:hypothetical protein